MKKIKDFIKNYLPFSRWILGFFRNKKFLPSLLNNIISIYIHFLKKEKIIFIHLQEHIGDIVACEPVSRYAKKNYSDYKVCWIINYKYISLIRCNKNINYIIHVTCILEWMILKKLIKRNKNNKIIDLHIDGRQDAYFPIKLYNPNKYGITLDNYYNYGSLLESFSLAAGLPKLDIQPIFHLCKNPKKIINNDYIVIHCSSNETDRDWDNEKWQILVKDLIKKGYYIVEIGLYPIVKIKDDKYINFCGRRDFQDIANIIAYSDLFIGIDSGFAHFANALKIPGIILLGNYRSFKKYLPYTGYYKEHKKEMIIQFEGEVKDIPISLVLDKVNILLKNIKQEEKFDKNNCILSSTIP